MKTDHLLSNPSRLAHVGWCDVWILALALQIPAPSRADGLPYAMPTPLSAACEGLDRSRSACPDGAPVAPSVPEAGSAEPESPEQVPGPAADGADDPILCACLSIEGIPLHDAIVYRYMRRAQA